MDDSRRQFLKTAILSAPMLGSLSPRFLRAAETPADEHLPPVRQLTQGPKFHWFGYYDKFQFSPDDRYILSNQVHFEGRSPTPEDVIQVGMIDTRNGDQWIELGETRVWCWQQGCMLQWLPGSRNEIIWNDRDGDHFVSRILNVETGHKRTLPHPIYNVSPDGTWSISPSFPRLNDRRPGYGYAGLPDPFQDEIAPRKSGLWRMDLATGKEELIFTLADARAIPYNGNPRAAWSDSAPHWFNHLLFNPDGTRFFFLHRWRLGKNGFGTRAFTINADGTDPFILDPYGSTSHFIWRDPAHVAAWAWHPSHQNAFYLYTDKADLVEPIGKGVMTVNGHNTYVPGTNNQLILNDTYPDADRLQHPYLYSIPANRKVPLGHFHSPPQYTGEWRCDTHPRSSRAGNAVCIDSPHNGGRQMYLIDISALVPA